MVLHSSTEGNIAKTLLHFVCGTGQRRPTAQDSYSRSLSLHLRGGSPVVREFDRNRSSYARMLFKVSGYNKLRTEKETSRAATLAWSSCKERDVRWRRWAL